MLTFDDHVNASKEYFITGATTGVSSLILTKLPFLNWGPLPSILKWGLRKIFSLAVFKTEVGAFFKFIDFRSSAQGRAYHKSISAYLKAKKDGSAEEIKVAETNMVNAFRALVKLTN